MNAARAAAPLEPGRIIAAMHGVEHTAGALLKMVDAPPQDLTAEVDLDDVVVDLAGGLLAAFAWKSALDAADDRLVAALEAWLG